MSAATTPGHAERAGRRIEEVLDRLTTAGDPGTIAAAEELVRSLMEFYGAGLARILQLLSAPEDRRVQERLLADDLVASQLVLHDLHPEDLPTRIARALDTLQGADLDVLDLDEVSGTLRLRAAAGGGCGCGSGATDVQRAAEDALACFAPEVAAVEVRPAEPALLQIGTRPGAGA
ncbi:hypothetical protein [Streptomyces brasiliensis]|uniref:NifU family protein n=1 Tax=Streptomyces brasiliensis TaxID=1954 RepID=A0A917NT01_9ACTN|nr:hypothetical protein [Streptomyces brasiliensis]GGJ26746.1 hypothetical protein GCM10010121_042430 [Streptomyces brasiliensis]